MSIVYKIKSAAGLYSKGGQGHVTWSKTGKTWQTQGALSSHLSGLPPYVLAQLRNAGAYIVEIVTEECEEPLSIDTWLAGVKQRRDKRNGVSPGQDPAKVARARELEQQIFRLNKELTELNK